MSKPLFQIQSVSKSFGRKILLEEATLVVQEGQHLGLVGINGSGKSTLLKMIAGEIELDYGEITFSRDLKLSYLRQESHFGDITTVEYIKSGGVEIWEAYQLGKDFGLTQDQLNEPILKLSGGYQMRAKLANLMAPKPNLLFLDEPTNYLDLETILILERFLQNFKGAFVLITHDREFMLKTCLETVEIENGKLQFFPGNLNAYEEFKMEWSLQQEAQAKNIDRKAKELESFINRFKAKASKAAQARSRMKALDRLEKIELHGPALSLQRIPMKEPLSSGKKIIDVQDIT
jgi:ATP-binding cassette subfamily F protein 3